MTRLLRPHSILSLILTGFILALLPLAAALALAVLYVDRLARQSQVAVVQAVEGTQGGRQLLNQITAMERNVRQYLVLQDPKLLQVYRDTHTTWRKTVERLDQLTLEAEQHDILQRLAAGEDSLFQIYGVGAVTPERHSRAVGGFAEVRDLARDFLTHSLNQVDRAVEQLQTMAADTTRTLSLLVAAAVPTVAALAGLFATLIVKPLRRIAAAIQRLGNEDFATPVQVWGPRDLEELGARLDWLRRRLAESEDQKNRFLRHISHELKTPLTSLREGAELLGDEVLGSLNQEQREVAAIVQANSVRLQRLIEDLLNFNQILSRTLTLRPEPVDLALLVRQVIESQRLAWKARNLSVRAQLAPVRLLGDRQKLATVFDNLLSNAVKFSNPGGTIVVRLDKTVQATQLTVHDSGPGFDPADQDRVFEAFYQGRPTAGGHVRGSGLGLAIASEYALAHGGRLEIVDPQSPGGRIRLVLPPNGVAQ
jgi:two-component system sensor histidine kinase GlrK